MADTPATADALVEGISKRLDGLVSKEDVAPLQKDINELRADVKALQAPKPALIPATCKRFSSLKAFKSDETAFAFGMQVLAKIHHDEPKFQSTATAKAMKWCNEHGWDIIKATNQVEGVNTQGGNVVFDQVSSDIISLIEQYGVFRQNARIIPMTSDTFRRPRRTGGLTGYWVDEVTAPTVSNKTWNQVTLNAKKYAYLVRWSSELNEDAIINMADDLAFEIAYGMAYNEDLCGFIGDGTSTYGGITGAVTAAAANAGTIVTATSITAATSLTIAWFAACIGKLPRYAQGNAKWYVHNYFYANAMARLQWGGGGNQVAQIAGPSQMSFLGFPVVISQAMPTTDATTEEVCLFGDLRLAADMGIRRDVEIQTSTERYFDTDELAIRGTERFDINVHDAGTASVAGPIVLLKLG